MNRKIKIILTYLISFILGYFIIGYLKNNVGVAIHWVENVALKQKFNEYYIRTFVDNIIPTAILAIIPTFIVIKLSKKTTK